MTELGEEQMAQVKQFVNTFPEEEREAKLEEVLSQVQQQEPGQPAQCPFCLMSEGKIPTQKVFEDDDFLAVLEINPANLGHVLLLPKRHVQVLDELGGTLPHFLLLSNSIASSLLKFNPGVNILVSEGPASGKRFEHLVVNIIPRLEKDEVVISWKPKPVDEKELEGLREKISAGMAKKDEVKEVPVEEEKVDMKEFKKRMLSPEKRSP